jgi:hypothetical protein
MAAFRRILIAGAVLTTCIAAIADARPAGTPAVRETLRFDVAVALPGVTLAPGVYTFEVEPGDRRDTVRVREGRGNRLVFDGPALAAERPRGLKANKSILFGACGRNEAPPIVAWFPRGRVVGVEFEYGAALR